MSEESTPRGEDPQQQDKDLEQAKSDEPKDTEPEIEVEVVQPEAEPKEEEPKEEEPKEEEPRGEEPKGEEPKGEEPKVEELEPEEEDEEEPDDGVPRVLVTGASGFIASHVTKYLLEEGCFRVRGTVRSKKNMKKIQPLLDLAPDAKYPLRLIEADLQKAESWAKAVKSCSYVFHLASPFPPAGSVSPQDEEEKVIRPAVDGTINVLQACADAGTVKRVVLTSSIAAVSCGVSGNPTLPPDHVYSENDWSDEQYCTPYPKSKLLAEKAAWDFMKKLDEDKRFELVAVNPGYVQGPFLSRASGGTSKDFCLNFLNGKLPAVPDISLALVDVRDVVAAHIAALKKSEAVGNRYVLVADTINMREVARIISDEFKPQGYKISTMNLPKIGMWVAKFFNSGYKEMYDLWGKNLKYSTEKMVGELGVTPHSIKETIIDTCYNLIELGEVRKTPGYLGHPSTRPPPPAKEEPAAATTEEASAPEQQEETPAKESEPTQQPPADTNKDEKPSSEESEPTHKDEEAAAKEEPESTDKPPEAGPADDEPKNKE